jgi:hypothetical protein
MKHEMVGQVAHMGKRTDVYRVLLEKSDQRSHFEDLGMGG